MVDRVPNENVKNLDRFKDLFGEEGLKVMIENFPGVAIRFPSTLDYNKEERNKKIASIARSPDYANMQTMELANQFAQQFGLSLSHTLKIMNDPKNR